MELLHTTTNIQKDSCDNSACQDPVNKSQNAENNPPINDDVALVAPRENDADSNRSHTIPIITISCLVSLIYPILNHVFDFVSDIRLIIEYFENQKTVQASLTLVFTILQAIASVWISFLMHHPKMGQKDEHTGTNRVQRMAKVTVYYSLVIALQRALPMCHLRKLYYAWRVRDCQQKGDKVLLYHYHCKMLKEDRDSAVLEVMECFLQSAPQIVLQLFILLTEDSAISDPMWAKVFSGGATVVTLSQTMKNYHCANRLAQPDKAVIGETGGYLLLLWHLGTIAARILVIGIATSTWLSYTLLVCVINWLVWTVWIYANENVLCILHGKNADSSSCGVHTVAEKIRNFFLASVLAVVYTFTFINLRGGPTFVRNSFYYVVCLCQNGAVFVFWFMLTSPILESTCLSQFLLIVSVISFFIGIGAMITYYMFFHPNLEKGFTNINAQDCVTCV